MEVRREYWLNGNLYKELVGYYDNEKMYTERYFMNGYLHREDGPAVIYYWPNGKIKEEKYYKNDQLHRLNGPAFIQYYKDGTVKRESYWIDGKEYDPFKWMVKVGSMKE